MLVATLAHICRGEVVYDVELLKAAEHGHADRVDYIINHGAFVEVKNNFGVTPLIWAANNNHLETMKTLLNRGADIEATANNGRSPLMWAATWGHMNIAEHLLSIGVNMEVADKDGMTALLLAVQNNRPRMVSLLLNNGANVSAVNSLGGNSRSIAAAMGHQMLVDMLGPKQAETVEPGVYDIMRLYNDFIMDLLSAIYTSAKNGEFSMPQLGIKDINEAIAAIPSLFSQPVVRYLVGISVLSTMLSFVLPFIWNVVIDRALDKAVELTDPKRKKKDDKKLHKDGVLHNSSLDLGDLDVDVSAAEAKEAMEVEMKSPKHNGKPVVVDFLAELRPTLVTAIPFLSSVPHERVRRMLAKSLRSEV